MSIGENAASGAAKWAGSQAMATIFGNFDQKEILKELKEIPYSFAKMSGK